MLRDRATNSEVSRETNLVMMSPPEALDEVFSFRVLRPDRKYLTVLPCARRLRPSRQLGQGTGVGMRDFDCGSTCTDVSDRDNIGCIG